jgi:ureidoglycolate lyase
MNAQTVDIRIINSKPATPETVAPYGQILGYNPNIKPMPIEFYGGTVKVRRVVDFVSDDQTEIPVVTVNRRPFEVRWMERHFKHTQTFIPLGGKPNDNELPDLDKVEVLQFDGSAGFTMKLGTWHEFPFAIEDETHLIVVLRKEATDGLVRDMVVQNEAQSPDLDKKDLLQRCNVTFRFEA